jgi:NADH dehydrogenase FAD-containing subunit
MSKTSDHRKNIVVVGGGVAGLPIARALSAKLDASQYDLILVNPRPFAIHLLAGARITTSSIDHLEDTAFIPYDKVFLNGKGSLKIGKVTAIDANREGKGGVLTLQDGEKLPYELLVLAPGSSWNGAVAFPDDVNELKEWLKYWHGKYEKAKHIVLAGGGAVGIETAGEIKDRFPVGFRIRVAWQSLEKFYPTGNQSHNRAW